MQNVQKLSRNILITTIVGAVLTAVFVVPHATAQELQYRKSRSIAVLEGITQQLKLSEKRKAELGQEISLLKQDRTQISEALIQTAKRTRELEAKLDVAEARLTNLGEREQDLTQSLHKRRALLSQVLAALQRMGRKPPPALLVRPDDALASVRSAVLLGAVVPEVRAETRILVADLQELSLLRKSIFDEKKRYAVTINSLSEDNVRLSLLVDEKFKLEGKTRKALDEQGRAARALADKATSLKQLIASLNAQISDAELAAKKVREAEQARRLAENSRLSAARNSDRSKIGSQFGRIVPQVRFTAAKGKLQLPVVGVEVRSFGEKSNAGTISKGAIMATRTNALVVSPVDARIVYAGPFRSYGQLLILDAGEQVHIVMAGMERVNVGTGQFVLAGEPVAKMGSRRIASVAAVDVASSRPMLYIEFRKDGKSFDPAPWWADSAMKRSRNDS